SALISIPENTVAVTDVDATDPDAGTTLTYSLAGGADQALFGINGVTGALSFHALPNFEAPSDANGDNVYEVLVQASDGLLVDTQTLSITVTDINEAPIITSNGGLIAVFMSVPENTTAVTDVDAIDPEGVASVTYAITGGSDAAKFNINASTGVLTFIAAPD